MNEVQLDLFPETLPHVLLDCLEEKTVCGLKNLEDLNFYIMTGASGEIKALHDYEDGYCQACIAKLPNVSNRFPR